MKTNYFLSVVPALLLGIQGLFAQLTKVDQEIIFQSKIDNAVTLEVLDQGEKFVFVAQNRSFYPYSIEIKFDELQNLTPEIRIKKFNVSTGRNNLFTLSVKDNTQSHSFKYNFSYRIGIPGKKPITGYPYLIPLGIGRNIQLKLATGKDNIYLKDYFSMQKGDTVFCMRKGYVAAVPDMFHVSDRISTQKSLEIIHGDETVMIYGNIDPDNVFVKPGTTIYPGQPLGLISDESGLDVVLFQLEEEGKLQRLDIKYVTGTDKVASFSPDFAHVRVVHPIEIITKEMSKKEIKNYSKWLP